MQHRNVVIIGAGPVGLMTGIQLARRDIRVTILEKSLEPATIPRAIVADEETLRAFEEMGFPLTEGDHYLPGLPVRFVNGKRKTIARVDHVENICGHPGVNSIYQPDIEAQLRKAYATFGGELIVGAEVTQIEEGPEGVMAHYKQDGEAKQLACRFLVGCDGGQSQTRDHIGATLRGTTYQQRWLVVDLETDPVGTQEVTFFCDPARPAVSLPVPGGKRRFEFLMLSSDTDEGMLCPQAIQALAQDHGAKTESIAERATIYTFHARVADTWRRGNIFLAGDAAHLMPPFAGQGMNGGLRDAANLGWKLAAVIKGKAPESLLDTYQCERAPHITRMTNLAVFMGRIIMPLSRIGAGLRDAMLGLVHLLPPVRNLFEKGMMKPKPRISGRRGIEGTLLPAGGGTALSGEQYHFDALLGSGYGQLNPHDNSSVKVASETTGDHIIRCAADDPVLKLVLQHGTITVRPDKFISHVGSREADRRVPNPFAKAF
ncbi:FAD-dependent monooxygenase [Kordiimonas lacus]|jgi:3-(3-hydroxy-phenyl)propionate hydroxylase|uniref:FAD-dependent monooxygenase n=2 Tax=Kordiimonas TaxID=288021 RepID=UPI00257EB798|nr:FAD-dependent monooxygenase [Kordiimonas sp. UBA4487]